VHDSQVSQVPKQLPKVVGQVEGLWVVRVSKGTLDFDDEHGRVIVARRAVYDVVRYNLLVVEDHIVCFTIEPHEVLELSVYNRLKDDLDELSSLDFFRKHSGLPSMKHYFCLQLLHDHLSHHVVVVLLLLDTRKQIIKLAATFNWLSRLTLIVKNQFSKLVVSFWVKPFWIVQEDLLVAPQKYFAVGVVDLDLRRKGREKNHILALVLFFNSFVDVAD